MFLFAALELGQHTAALEHAKSFLAKHGDHPLAPDVLHVVGETYVQKNRFTWKDGRVFEAEFGGELRGDRIFWDTDRFEGYGWATLDDVVMLTLDRKDRPGESFTEIIVLAPDRSHRARTWHWFKKGALYQRTLCDERRVS